MQDPVRVHRWLLQKERQARPRQGPTPHTQRSQGLLERDDGEALRLPAESGRPPRRGRGRGGRRGGGSNPPREEGQTKGKGAKLNGDSVCYHYNRAAGCSRTVKGAGCDNGNGGVYAHVCNFESSPGVYCLSKNPKVGNQ